MTALSTLIEDDQDYFDDVELSTVTLRTRRTGGTEVDQTCSNARRLALQRSEQQFVGVQLSSDGIRWILKDSEVTATVSTTVVRAGDLILVGAVGSPDEVWKVVQVSLKTLNTLWSCLCVKQEA